MLKGLLKKLFGKEQKGFQIDREKAKVLKNAGCDFARYSEEYKREIYDLMDKYGNEVVVLAKGMGHWLGEDFYFSEVRESLEKVSLDELRRLSGKYPIGYMPKIIEARDLLGDLQTDEMLAYLDTRADAMSKAGWIHPINFIQDIYLFYERMKKAHEDKTPEESEKILFKGKVTDVGFRDDSWINSILFNIPRWIPRNRAEGVVEAEYTSNPVLLEVFLDLLKSRFKIESITISR